VQLFAFGSFDRNGNQLVGRDGAIVQSFGVQVPVNRPQGAADNLYFVRFTTRANNGPPVVVVNAIDDGIDAMAPGNIVAADHTALARVVAVDEQTLVIVTGLANGTPGGTGFCFIATQL